jgi:hypothetical protein
MGRPSDGAPGAQEAGRGRDFASRADAAVGVDEVSTGVIDT